MRLKFGGVVESFWRGSEIEMVSVSHLIVARKACLKRRWRHFGNYSPSVKRLPGKCLALCTSQRSVNRIGLRPSGPRSRPSTNDRKPRTPAGKGEGAIGSRAAVRAVTRPFPGAFFEHSGGRAVIWRAEPAPTVDAVPGTVLREGGETLIACGSGSLRVLEAQGLG